MSRVDIFIEYKGNANSRWHCYVESVTLTNAKHIVSSLESQGEHVALFKHTKALGQMVYETGEQS